MNFVKLAISISKNLLSIAHFAKLKAKAYHCV